MIKHAVALCLFTSTLALFAPPAQAAPRGKTAHAKAQKAAPAKAPKLSQDKPAKAPKLSQDKPATPVFVAEPAKLDTSSNVPKQARPSYWLAANPHVPLATVEGKSIRGVGQRGKDCGAQSRWARPKSRWHAVDAWGRITGHYEVAGAETFDVTHCREVSFNALGGKHPSKPGAGLFVSDDSGYKPGDSAAFAPTAPEKKRFERLLGSIESAFVNQKPLGKYVPWGERTMFFEVQMPRDARWEGRLDGAGKPLVRPRRWAVSGGAVLTIAYLGQQGQWHAAEVLPPLGLADSYRPVAVFDMNGDGVPEIVYQTAEGPNFADVVLSLDTTRLRWAEVAESPGGAVL